MFIFSCANLLFVKSYVGLFHPFGIVKKGSIDTKETNPTKQINSK
jgi:hypothetical protein